MKALYLLVGSKFRSPTEQKVFKSIRKGDHVALVREPTNKFDSNAVKAMVGNNHVAYVIASDARILAGIMDSEHHTEVNGSAAFMGAGIYVEVEHAES